MNKEENVHEYLQRVGNGGRKQVVCRIDFKHIAQVPVHVPIFSGYVHTACGDARDEPVAGSIVRHARRHICTQRNAY